MKAVPEKTPTAPAHPDTAPRSDQAPAPSAPAPDRRAIQRLQRAAGNAAVSRLVAQRYTAPVTPAPAQAPGFRSLKASVAAKKTRIAVHPPAAAESKASQDAAVAPPDDREAQGKAANAEKMNAAKPGEFDKKAFVDAVNKAIDAQAPKNLDEADKFSKSGKAEKVKAEVDGKVTAGKESSVKDIGTATKAPPDTSAAKDKPVTPLTPDQPPGNPGAPSAADAIPAEQPPAVTDFSEGPAQNDQTMADAEITEDQLAKGNEPEFNAALAAKKTAETDSAKAPAKGRAAESRQLNTAKAGAAASGAAAMSALTATRAQAGQKVDGGKGETKSKDEKKRAEVTAKLQKVYDGTKKDVETTLSDLDKKVDTAFTAGEKAARDAFTADHKRRMKKYKDKRYSGWTGKARWVKDKFAGLPQEANNLYQEARKLYVAQMQTVISSVADLIGTELGKAKARIAKGRTEIRAEVDRLPAALRQFGEEAAKDFAGKFDDLESTVDEKSEQLVQDLASKYTAALNKIDEEIKKLQEANKGLIDKAKDAIVGVIQTINELKNLLLGILAKAAGAIMKIIKDPIGFLGNLVRAVGAGLELFVTNIAEHLKTGVVSWLLGTAVKAGLELPQKFDMKGIVRIIGSLLGLTWDNIKARVTRKGVPAEAMAAVETSVPVAKNIAAEGPAGAVKEIQAEAGDLKATILQKLTTYLIPTVIIAGITWILSLLNPASAFIRAVKGIIDIVTFVVTQGSQIAEFVNAVLDAVVAIANGGQAGVPKMVETALAASVPLLIGFLASLLGIGSLANKVKSVFHAVARPVNRAIDKIVDLIAKKGRSLWNKLKEKTADDTTTKPPPRHSKYGEREAPGDQVRIIDTPTSIGPERHTLRARATRTRLSILMASGSFEEIHKKIELLGEVSNWMKDSTDKRRRQSGVALDKAIEEVIVAAQTLMARYASTPDSPSRDRMVTSGLHDLSEMIHGIGVRFRLHGFDFRRPEHNLVPSAVDQYGRALAYSGDPLSLASKNKGTASSGVYTPGIDIGGVGPLQRGHLVADLLGGPGNDRRNLSTITTTTNTAMKKPERAVADFIYKGDISNQVTYSVSIEHLHNDATAYQSWLSSKFATSNPGAGEHLFLMASTHHPSPNEINTTIGISTLTQGDHEIILQALAYYLISSRVLFSINSNPGPSNTIPAPSGSPISNSIPAP
ncbi:DNA/RNA non-specific endonuclease [Streptomyces sp. NPDC005426]|uniref:DNA/RNA non-specific endonuclease n=1 Tax=Streptomyces sp. NPDC005426 TaxID=3155344 RepID=UPI0033B01232